MRNVGFRAVIQCPALGATRTSGTVRRNVCFQEIASLISTTKMGRKADTTERTNEGQVWATSGCSEAG